MNRNASAAQVRQLMDAGRLPEAEQLLRRMLAKLPKQADLMHLLAITLSRRNDRAAALALCEELLALHPDNASFWNTRGVVLRGLGRPQQAIESYDRALAIQPDYTAALANRGRLLGETGRWTEAEADYRELVRLAPGERAHRLSLMQAMQGTGRIKEALALWQALDETSMAMADAQAVGGGLHFALHQYQEAYACWSRSLTLNPEQEDLLADFAMLCNKLGRWAEAQKSVEQALALDPENAWIHLVRLIVSLPVAQEAACDDGATLAVFRDRLAALEQWARDKPQRGRDLIPCVTRLAPFDIAYWPGNHCSLLSAYGDFVAGLAARHLPVPARGATAGRRRLRLGIVSSHICRHSVWDMVLKGLVAHIDRSRFELYFYMLGGGRDAQTDWARQQADGWRDVSEHGQDPQRWLKCIADDAPDVLFYPELGMNGLSYLLASMRLAPVQAAGWGHPVTSGLAAVDHYFSAALFESQTAQSHYRESLVLLPGTGSCTRYEEAPADEAPELEARMKDIGGVRMLLPHAPFKLHPQGDALLVRIAQACPQARFLFVRDAMFGAISDIVMTRIAAAFVQAGLNPAAHLFALPWQRRSTFARLLELSDIYLDWPTFSGYTTAWHGVHSGLPIVTLEGAGMRQRLASGLLRRIGRADTIADSADAYVAIAAGLAAEAQAPGHGAERRARLRAAALLADEDVGVVRAFEEKLLELHAAPKDSKMDKPARYPWDILDATENNHWLSLRQDYAPVGLIDMLDIPPQRSLDVGCFVGATSALIKQRHPACHTVGIEPSLPAAERARTRVDTVHAGLLEDVDMAAAGYGPGHFDVIILADVLEHMYNPWGALKSLKPLLSARGCILASIPNARNLSVLGQLANGRWRYEPAGLLDVTHIRFFTRADVQEMFAATGYQIDALVHNPDPRWRSLMDSRETTRNVTAGKLTLTDLSAADVAELATLQFYIRARPMR